MIFTATMEYRFMVFTEKTYPEPNTGCWIWGGAIHKNGYANFKAHGFTLGHRYSYFHYNGDFDRKLHVLHKCDNPACVNPDHLYLGDQKQNVKDRVSRGRSARILGTKNGRSKLDEDTVRQIRLLHNPDTYPTRELARMFGVSQRLIFNIIHRLTWRHI